MKKFFSEFSYLLFFIAGLLTASIAFAGAPSWVTIVICIIVGLSSSMLPNWLSKNN